VFMVFSYKTLTGCFSGAEEASRAVNSESTSWIATKILLREEEERILGMGADEFVR